MNPTIEAQDISSTAEPKSLTQPQATSEPQSEAISEPENPQSEILSEPENSGLPEPDKGSTSEPENPQSEVMSEPENSVTMEPGKSATSEPESEGISGEGNSPESEGSPEGESRPEDEDNGKAESEGEAEAETRPSPYEIILPPFGFMVLIGTGLLLISINFSSKSTNVFQKAGSFAKQKVHGKIENNGKFNNIIKVASREKARDARGHEDEFFSDFDREVLDGMKHFHNHPWELLRIATPALLSLGLCPFTLYLYQPLTTLFWDPKTFKSAPNINDAISCFLAPAGLVYATSFGFAFQQALSKQTNVLSRITYEVGLLDQIITLTSKMNITQDSRLEIYRAIKTEAIFMVLQTANRPLSKFKTIPEEDIKVKIWSIIDKLREMALDPKMTFDLDRILADQVVSHILELNSICSDRMSAMHSRIHPLKWAFLESLGFFSFFGILLLRAESYRVELTMCIVTVFSISLLCYVVSDLDSPFSGVFRIDLSILPEVILRVHKTFRLTSMGLNVVCDYPERQ